MENQEPEFYKQEPEQQKVYYTPVRRKQLPNATAVLVLGIISIPTSFCYGFIGITLGIIALVLAKKDLKLHKQYPDEFDGYDNLNIGRICAIIGLSIGSLIFLLLLMYILFAFTMIFSALPFTN